jgi:hypothetical protein
MDQAFAYVKNGGIDPEEDGISWILAFQFSKKYQKKKTHKKGTVLKSTILLSSPLARYSSSW